jgi:hypothetical protein
MSLILFRTLDLGEQIRFIFIGKTSRCSEIEALLAKDPKDEYKGGSMSLEFSLT